MDHKVIRPRGRWVDSASTDISKTFKRVTGPLHSVRFDLTPDELADREAYIKAHQLPF